MTDSSSDQPAAAAATELFQQLGLSQYEAHSYVSLLRLGSGTARELSEISEVPRTRIYDAIESLQEQGLVDVKHASPKVFQPIARETVLDHFRREYNAAFTQLETQLDALTPAEPQPDHQGAWTTTGRDAIDERVVSFFADATDEIIYLTTAELLTDALLDELAAAAERDVSISIADSTAPTHERIQAAVPSAELTEPPWDWHTAATGRFLFVDRETVLMSALSDDAQSTETAVWGRGPQNSLVTVLETIVAWWLDGTE